MSLETLDSKQFDDVIRQGTGYAVVDFFAKWCGPCKLYAPIMEKFSAAMPNVPVYSCDIDDNQDLTALFSVMSVPTTIFFKNGQEIGRLAGVRSLDELKEALSG